MKRVIGFSMLLFGMMINGGTLAQDLYQLESAIITEGNGEKQIKWGFPSGFATLADQIAVQERSVRTIMDGELVPFHPPGTYVEAVLSNTGQFIAITSFYKHIDATDPAVPLRAGVYTPQGDQQYKVELMRYADEPDPMLCVSDADGALIAGRAATSTLFFFDATGTLLREVNLFPDAEHDLERILRIAMADDGKTIAVLAQARGMSPEGADVVHPSGEPHVFLFDKQGHEQWRVPLSGAAANTLALSPDGAFIAANVYTVKAGGIDQATVLLDRAGRQIGQTDVLAKHIAFSPDAQRVLLADNHNVALMETTTGTVSWQATITHADQIIAAVAIAGERFAILSGTLTLTAPNAGFVYQAPELTVHDGQGNLLQTIDLKAQNAPIGRQDVPLRELTFIVPTLHFSIDGQHIVIGGTQEVRLYRMKEEQ